MTTWKDKNGKVWNLWDMETSHIENCIKILEKAIDSAPEEQFYMGDSDCAESVVDAENRHNTDMLEELEDKLGALKNELKERKNGKPIHTSPKVITAVIHTCDNCGKIDATYHDGHSCPDHEVVKINRAMCG